MDYKQKLRHINPMHIRLKIIATVVDCMTALVKLIDIKNFSAGKQKNERSILSVSISRRNAI